MASTTSGKCLCGKIQYELSGPPIMKVLCHCDNCRRSTGSVCMMNGFYNKDQLIILCGKDDLRAYEDNETDAGVTVIRSFCNTCGSPLFITNDYNPMLKDKVIVTAGTMSLDFSSTSNTNWAPEMEFYCKRRAAWLPALDATERFEGMT